MKKINLIILLYSIVFSAIAEEDDFWLLLDAEPKKNSLWLSSGIDENDGSYASVNGSINLLTSTWLNISTIKQNYFVKTQETRIGFNGDFNQTFGWGVYRSLWGQKNVLEKTTTQFMLHYFLQNINVRLAYENGNIDLFLRELETVNRDALSTGHSATQVGIGYNWKNIAVQLSYKKQSYEANLSGLLNNRQFLFVANPLAVQQASGLAEMEASLLLSFQLEAIHYELVYYQIKSVFGEDALSYTSLYLLKEINSQYQLGLDIDLPLNNNFLGVGLTLGYFW